MIERQILQVLYSPFKAFEEIVKNPVSRGPLIILALGVITAVIAGYASSSKVYIQESADGNFVPLVTSDIFGGRMLAIVVDGALRLTLVWFIYTGVMLLVIKVFGLSGVSWRALLFVIGFTLMTTVVYTLIGAFVVSALPTVYLKWGVWNPTPETEEAAYQEWLSAHNSWFSSPLYQFVSYLSFVIEAWTAALAAIAVHALFGVTWKKAVAISALATILAYLTKTVLLSL